MLEKLYDEFCEERHRPRRLSLSVLAIYFMLNPFVYLFSISQDKVFLNFGVRDWRFALLYCVGAPLLGYLLWTLPVRTVYALYAFLGFEVVRGWRHGYWDVVLFGAALLITVVWKEVRSRSEQHAGALHR